MSINFIKDKAEKYEVSITEHKNGYRASLTLKYKDGTTERIQKFSSESPQKAEEKVYKVANEKYMEHLKQSENEVVFAPLTNKTLVKLEETIPSEVAMNSKYNLEFTNVVKDWLSMCLKKTDKTSNLRTINNNTFEFYRTMINGYLNKDYGGKNVGELTHDMIQNAFDSHVNLKAKTLSKLLNILSQIMDYCVKRQFISSNPVKNIELPAFVKPKIDFYTPSQIKIFKNICDGDGRALAMLYRTNISLGLRPEEGCGLKWNRIKFSCEENRLAVVTIDNAVKDIKIYDSNHNIIGHEKKDDTLKTLESYRSIPLQKGDEEALLKYKQIEMKRLGGKFSEDGYVFLNRDNRPYTSEILTNKMPMFLDKYKLPHLTPYGLRHSFASYMAKIGVKESILKTIMGHSDISTTQKYYIHITENDVIDEVIDKLSIEEEKEMNRTIEKRTTQKNSLLHLINKKEEEFEEKKIEKIVADTNKEIKNNSIEIDDRMGNLEEMFKTQMKMFSKLLEERAV
jgi:integrase